MGLGFRLGILGYNMQAARSHACTSVRVPADGVVSMQRCTRHVDVQVRSSQFGPSVKLHASSMRHAYTSVNAQAGHCLPVAVRLFIVGPSVGETGRNLMDPKLVQNPKP